MRFEKILEKRWKILQEQEGELPADITPEDAKANDLKGEVEDAKILEFKGILLSIANFLSSEKLKTSENKFSPLLDEMITQMKLAATKDDSAGLDTLDSFLKGKSEVSAEPTGIETGAPTPTYSDQEPQ